MACTHENIGVAQDGSGKVLCWECGQEFVPLKDAAAYTGRVRVEEGEPTHLVIVRAVGADGASAEARLAVDTPPPSEALAEHTEAIQMIFEQTHGDRPTETSTAVLPWVNELDREED